MDMVSKYGQMGLNMKVIGEITKLMGKANFGMQMVMYMMDFGKKIKLMAMEFILMLMEQSMKVNGKMISNMAKE